jgi:integrase
MDHWRERSARAKGGRRPKQEDTPRTSRRTVGECYTTASYRKAIRRACDAAEVPVWHPHQLRHTAATELRAKYGLEAARAVLGHTSVAVTAIYAEADQAVSEKVAREVG